MMNVSDIRIRNFRGIKDLSVEFGEVTVLIGENNAGKTSVLDALARVGQKAVAVPEGDGN